MQVEQVEPLYQGWGRYLLVTLRDADGQLHRREVEDHGSAAAVLPYDAARGTVLLVRQPRTSVLLAGGSEDLLEAPAGRLEGDAPEDCARREAMEECGVRLRALHPVGSVSPMPGISTEQITLFLAEYRAEDRVAAGGGLEAEGERIEVVEMPAEQLWALEAAGRLPDLKTAYLALRLRLFLATR